ncbi:MAG: extracellular solute-binding protein [Patescibacteria group bacterium]
MFKKVFLVLALAMTIVLAGFGCKGLSATQQAATKPVTLEYWTVFDDVDAIKSMINSYRATRPYLTVNIRQLRVDEFYQRLVEALAEDRGPDIVSIRSKALRAFQSKLAPMPASFNDTTVVIEKTTFGQNTVVTQTVKPLLTPSQLDKEYVQAVKNDVILDGQIYGLPLSLDTMAIYYNKDLLDRSSVPEPPKTWEEFAVAVKKITKYDKQTNKITQSGAALGAGNNIPGADDLLSILFAQSGVDFVNRGGAAVFNSVPQNKERGVETPSMGVMNFYTDFANSTRDTYTWNEEMPNALDKFVNGSLGFFFGYAYHYPIIKSRAPQLNFGLLPMLQLNAERPVNAANYWVQAVVGKSPRQNEAWGLIDYLAHSPANKIYLDATNRPTALRLYVAAQKEKEELAPFIDGALIAKSWYHGRDYDAAVKAVSDMLREWLQEPPNPEKFLEFRQEILNRAAAKINQTL